MEFRRLLSPLRNVDGWPPPYETMSYDRPHPPDPVKEFGPALATRGFYLEEASIAKVCETLNQDDELRNIRVLCKEGASFYVGKHFVVSVAPLQIDELITVSENDNDDQALTVSLEETEGKDVGIFLAAVHPLSLSLPVEGRVTVASLPTLASVAHRFHARPLIEDVVIYYLSRTSEVPAFSKLLLASQLNNELLAESTLYRQCGKESTIKDIVEDPEMFDKIEGPNAMFVVKRMLEHQTKFSYPVYREDLRKKIEDLEADIRVACATQVDFSVSSSEWSPSLSQGESSCALSFHHDLFYASRWWLAAWSPVFYRMLYGDFTEGRMKDLTIPLDEDGISREGVGLFLSLIHPSHMMYLWALLPGEMVHWTRTPLLEELYALIFSRNLDILMEVFRLSHKFQVNSLLEFCVLMLEVNSEFTLAERLQLADAYHLPQLLARCLSKMTTARGVKRMIQDNPSLLDDLSCPAHKLLMERLLELV